MTAGTPSTRAAWLACAAALTLAGAAQAEPLAQYRAPEPSLRSPASPPLDLSTARTPLALSYAQAAAMRQAGVARTSLDHRFSGDGLTGSVGFLCGLQPRTDEASGSAYGIDPHGRFVGAKLSRAF